MDEKTRSLLFKDPKSLGDEDLRLVSRGVAEHRRWLGPTRMTRLLSETKDRFDMSWEELAGHTGYGTPIAFGIVRSA